jgi:hypothetical protein
MIVFLICIIVIFIIFFINILRKSNKFISIFLFLVFIVNAGLFYYIFFYPPQRVVYDRKINIDKITQLMDNNDFGKFLCGFKPVKLPIRFKSANFEYKDFTDIPDEYINKYLNFYYSFDFLSPPSYINNISEYNNIKNENIFKIEVKKPKYTFMPVINDNFFACIFMVKVYNDYFKNKSQYMYLVTFNKKGIPLSCLKVGKVIYYCYNNNFTISPNPSTKSLCTIYKDYTIKYSERTGYYHDDGEYSETGWESPEYYKINENGIIVKIQKEIPRIKRDE